MLKSVTKCRVIRVGAVKLYGMSVYRELAPRKFVVNVRKREEEHD